MVLISTLCRTYTRAVSCSSAFYAIITVVSELRRHISLARQQRRELFDLTMDSYMSKKLFYTKLPSKNILLQFSVMVEKK